VVNDGLSGRSSTRKLPCSYDCSSPVLNGGDELALKPSVILNRSTNGLFAWQGNEKAIQQHSLPSVVRIGSSDSSLTFTSRDIGMVDVWVLSLGVVAPDDDVVDLADVQVQTFGDLALAPVVVQASEAAEVLLGQIGGREGGDQSVGVGRVANNQNLSRKEDRLWPTSDHRTRWRIAP